MIAESGSSILTDATIGSQALSLPLREWPLQSLHSTSAWQPWILKNEAWIERISRFIQQKRLIMVGLGGCPARIQANETILGVYIDIDRAPRKIFWT